jgi:hypothetical protein
VGWNRLGDRRVRRYARLTGLPIEAAITRGGSGHVVLFRTAGDQHGRLYPDGRVEWGLDHWAGCTPGRRRWYRRARADSRPLP